MQNSSERKNTRNKSNKLYMDGDSHSVCSTNQTVKEHLRFYLEQSVCPFQVA